MAKSPDIARFGAALPPGAEEIRADDAVATYAIEARLDDLKAFYASIYGKTKGMTVEVLEEPPPTTIAVAVGPKCQEAEFSMLLVRSAGKADKPRAHEITVFARGGDEGGGYPDSNPWMQRPKKR